jgi:hypothetical protein
MPKKFKGRPEGSKNKGRTALPIDVAERLLSESAAQTVETTAAIFGTTKAVIYGDIAAGRLPAFMLGEKLWRVPREIVSHDSRLSLGADHMAQSAELLVKLNRAVAAANEAENNVETARAELVSRSKAVGLLLLAAKKLHPAGKDFEAFLRRVDGLKVSRAYDYMRVAGGRTTDDELKKEARERQRKSRAKKKPLPRPTPTLPEPEDSVTVTESQKRKIPNWMTVAQHSSRALAEFTYACRTYLPRILVETDREEVRRLVDELLPPSSKAEAA